MTTSPNLHKARLQEIPPPLSPRHPDHHSRWSTRIMLPKMLRTKSLGWVCEQFMVQPWLHNKEVGHSQNMPRRPPNKSVTKPVVTPLALYYKERISISQTVTKKSFKDRKHYPLCSGSSTFRDSSQKSRLADKNK